MKTLLEEVKSLSTICDIKALIHQVHQIKTELENAGSQFGQVRVSFKYSDMLNGYIKSLKCLNINIDAHKNNMNVLVEYAIRKWPHLMFVTETQVPANVPI